MGPLLCDPAAKASLEGRNGAEQLEYLAYLVDRRTLRLQESHVLELQTIAVRDIYACGGQYRSARFRVEITNSKHVLPEPAFVPSLVREAVRWINENPNVAALDRAAYALWRFNWIHPFAGGNGRTSRAVAYLILCMDMGDGHMLPGVPSMPTLIYDNRDEYLYALRAVDESLRGDRDALDMGPIAGFLRRLLSQQLAAVVDEAER